MMTEDNTISDSATPVSQNSARHEAATEQTQRNAETAPIASAVSVEAPISKATAARREKAASKAALENGDNQNAPDSSAASRETSPAANASSANTSSANTSSNETLRNETQRNESATDESAPRESAANETLRNETQRNESATDESASRESAANETMRSENVSRETMRSENVSNENVSRESAANETMRGENAPDNSRDNNDNSRAENFSRDANTSQNTMSETTNNSGDNNESSTRLDENARDNMRDNTRSSNAPRAVRLPEMRGDERQPEVRSLEARNDGRNNEARGDRGLRFRGREGRAELRRNDSTRFRTRHESGNGNNRNDGNRNDGNRNDGNRNENRDNRNDNNRNDNRNAQGRLQPQRENGRENNGRDDNRQYENRTSERDIVRNQNDLDLTTLEEKNLTELREIAKELDVSATAGLKKSELVVRILEAQAQMSGNLFKKGILEIMPDGKGFLRTEGYLSSNEDVYISQSQIKRFNLKTGDIVSGQVRAPKEMERYYGLLRVEACNGEAPDLNKVRKEFEKLTPIFPNEKFNLETKQENITARIIDLVAPIGKGQRGLIVAPPKAGKTSLIKNVANSIMSNHPDVHLIVLLIDERPEEVTDIARSVRGEVVASTFDEMPENHIRVADMVLEKAKRMVEQKKDVVILLDSITRLSRASNLVVAPSGRTMSGGLDPAAMYKPKRLFGAARNIEEGGSLTILATVLVDTGSRMDEYIFEELKGTGNMDLVLDRNLFDQRIFPAIDINKSGTRRDDLLLTKDDLAAVFHLRRTLSALDNDKAINLLIDRLKNTKSNSDFMAIVQKSSRQQGAQAAMPSPAP